MFNMEAKLILRQGTSPFTENYRYKIQDGKYGRMEEVKDEAGDKVLKFIPYGMSILVKEILISMDAERISNRTKNNRFGKVRGTSK